MNVGKKEKSLATTVALGMALGGFALGRGTNPTAAIAATDSEPKAAVTQVLPGGQPRSFAPVVAAASPAVVHINVVSVMNTDSEDGPQGFGPGGPGGPGGPFGPFGGGPFGGRPPAGRGFTAKGEGSGFIIRKDGVVLTNYHVVDGAKEITVTLTDGREFPAKVLGRDPKTDLAVVKIQPTGGEIPVAALGDSEALQVGDWVVAIGSPYGLTNTVTAGIVSAKGRAIGSGPYDQFIQTDASINPGNSGGPLLNERGEVIGINSAIFSQTGGSVGIGFAIPIDLAKRLLPEMEETGHVTRGWLGVTVQKMTSDLARSLGVESTNGALVSAVDPKGPASQAGLQRGDVIMTWDGKDVKGSAALPELVASTPVGKSVSVGVVRDGKAKSIDVKVAKAADDTVAETEKPTDKAKWGLALRELDPQEREQRGLESGRGVLVSAVKPDSPAADANIQPGDVILEVNHKPVSSPSALQSAAEKTPEGKPLLLLVQPREGGERFTALAAR